MYILDDEEKKQELISMLLCLGFDYLSVIQEALQEDDKKKRLKYILLNECINELLKDLEKEKVEI